MDSHFTNIPLLEHIHNIGLKFTCSIQRNKQGLPNKKENYNLPIDSIKAYRSGSFSITKYRDKTLFFHITNFYKHRIHNSNSFQDDEEISDDENLEIYNKKNLK